MNDSFSILIVAIIGFTGQIVAVVVAAYLSQQAARKAQQAASAASMGLVTAQRDAALAQAAAAEAARQLVLQAQSTDDHLGRIEASTAATHKIVNGQRSALLRIIVNLSRRIANEHPDDQTARDSYIAAKHQLEAANDPYPSIGQ